eukprot:CAMPEP_0177253198 /NCGR_PEP_ID=MMETSP0367-20130122/55013_1 /TAXON_ID=447022 ORGANISM="Scrippsiella hangoei-like, Strain SHHI-4" /NCGR_SAMPLE_ID=MMETSP0367 /ASSEMBLY_ACC=CAM_ASM_000362 /LENGTH=250 /DNA_ID=CAMNT_0018706465 /DNA_START=64 /DNA_END=814 /DNA_ORIENTATION=+
MKKHGGEIPGWRTTVVERPGSTDELHQMWRADGAPFVHLQYRPAEMRPTDFPPERLHPLPDEEAPIRPIPAPLLQELESALRARDSAAFARAMEQLEAFDPTSQGFNDRLKHFTEGLQEILMSPALMADGGSQFVLQVIESRMRQAPKRSTGSLQTYTVARPNVARQMFRGNDMSDASVSTIAVPSHLDDWESNAALDAIQGYSSASIPPPSCRCGRPASSGAQAPPSMRSGGRETSRTLPWKGRTPSDI